jgi:two-component system response regulator
MKPGPILIAEDTPSDAVLTQRVLNEAGIVNPIHWVRDGSDVLFYLEAQVKAGAGAYPLPALILLDLRMPTPGSRVLKWLAGHPGFSALPVVVTTDSGNMADIRQAYDLGASSFLMKPVLKEDLLNLLRGLRNIRLQNLDGAISIHAAPGSAPSGGASEGPGNPHPGAEIR